MSSFPKELCFHLSDKLHPLDSECQTYGCRHSNPDICGACFITGICAFSSEDKVCRKPSAKWKKIYRTLKKEDDISDL